jgi:hypothetical protein
MAYSERLHLPGNQMSVWEILLEWRADDTTDVPKGNGVAFSMITGVAPNFLQGDGGCAVGGVGCQPGEIGVAKLNVSGGGYVDLEFPVWQLGAGGDTTSNPFGLAYGGKAERVYDVDADVASTVPVPTPIAMLGAAMLGFGWIARRRAQKTG